MPSRLGLKTLAAFSRQMGTMLDAGMPIRRSLAVMEKGARPAQKALYQRLGARIEQGESLADALEHERRALPVLFVRLVRVGEAVGGLDKVLKRLADYYDFVRAAWRRLLSRLAYPILQYFAAICVLALLTYILEIVDPDHHVPRPIPGFSGAMVLVGGILLFFLPIAAYYVATRRMGGLRATHELMVRVPVLGAVFRTLALARFSWSMELMTDAGVNIFNALEWSLQATANGAFEARGEGITQRIKDGVPLSRSLEMSGLFPADYVEMVHVAEESGSMPEMFGRLAKNYFEKADDALRALTTAFGWLIYICVGAFIIFFIFHFFLWYLSQLNAAMSG